MGLLERFGKGGATVAVELTAPVGQAGGSLSGHVVVTGGKRVQHIGGVKVWLAQTTSINLVTGTTDAVNDMKTRPRAVEMQFEVQPGASQRVPFELELPKLLPSSRLKVNGEPGAKLIEYAVCASADIKGQIDPQGKTSVEIAGGIDLELSI
jgi:sporulation-control protein spo0M